MTPQSQDMGMIIDNMNPLGLVTQEDILKEEFSFCFKMRYSHKWRSGLRSSAWRFSGFSWFSYGKGWIKGYRGIARKACSTGVSSNSASRQHRKNCLVRKNIYATCIRLERLKKKTKWSLQPSKLLRKKILLTCWASFAYIFLYAKLAKRYSSRLGKWNGKEKVLR